ncbi:hypothetical protein K2173_020769 [Erythroxylum novogranatense]|uniref:UBX domain-containing protein n=1 Tax=Erythroxylum novogranatense TaxID=1862640 RepID=A0AAV8TNV1_9ROSI|nr:hypothetical protein K2173_020769 [Erythroxylum novogranatense]
MVVDSVFALKRRRVTTAINSMEDKAKFAAVKEKFGRELRVFETASLSSTPDHMSNYAEENDDFYEFTAEDYYRLMAAKKDEKYLKTRKIREAEEAARRSRLTKAVMRVRFPDNHTLEATFHPSEKIQSLVDLLVKVVRRPELPFYIYTTPPKEQIRDFSQDFYTAGFAPGAIVYFSYDLSKDCCSDEDDIAIKSGPFLHEEIMSLKGLDVICEPREPVQSEPEPEPVIQVPAPVPQEPKSAGKKSIKPKWLKM